MIILMTRLNFCFKQLYIWTFPDQSTVKHNPDQGQDIWNMQNNSEKCDRSWRQGRHSSQNNLGGLSLSLSWPLTSLPALLQVWSLLMMSTCLVFYIYEQYFLSSKLQLRLKFFAVFLAGKNVLWIVVNVFELSFCNKLNGSNVKMWYAAQCLRFWLEVVAKVVTKGKQNSFWLKPRKCNNTLDRWPRRKVFFASPWFFRFLIFDFNMFLIKTSEVQ